MSEVVLPYEGIHANLIPVQLSTRCPRAVGTPADATFRGDVLSLLSMSPLPPKPLAIVHGMTPVTDRLLPAKTAHRP